ncbi:MAG: pilus assembly protein PilM [Candidatus Gorgyraea atricola]|nr:pilus assembly protein PilM [Candidatus Gorgyraea atricola]
MVKLANTSIGLDIGTRFIKLVELKRAKDNTILLNKFGVKEIPKDLKMDRDKVILQLISQLFSENNIKLRNVNIAAGGQSVFVRFVKLLQTKEDKLKQTMKFEAQNQIPFPLNEVAWDWSLLDKDKKATKKAVIVAIKKNLINDMIAKLKSIKLATNLIDVSPIALYNCMSFNEDYEEAKLGAILDIGERSSNLIIFKQGNIWIRSFPIAGERITEAKEQGIEELIGEIERSIEYYFMQSGEESATKKLNELILTGGGSLIQDLVAAISAKFDMAPKILDPFRKLQIDKSAFSNTESQGIKNQLAVAIGLGLRGMTGLKIEVNFLKEILLETQLLGQKGLYSKLSMAMTAVIIVSFSMFMRQDYSVKRAKLGKIDEMLELYRTYEPKIKKMQDKEDILKEKIDVLHQTASSRAVWLDCLKIISDIQPKELWVTDVSGIVSLEKSGLARLDMSGKAASYQSVTNFVSSLKSSPIFMDVKPISSSIETDETTLEEVVKFSITMDVVVTENE